MFGPSGRVSVSRRQRSSVDDEASHACADVGAVLIAGADMDVEADDRRAGQGSNDPERESLARCDRDPQSSMQHEVAAAIHLLDREDLECCIGGVLEPVPGRIDLRDVSRRSENASRVGMGNTVWAIKRFFQCLNDRGVTEWKFDALLARVGPRRTRVVHNTLWVETGTYNMRQHTAPAAAA